MTNTSPTSTTPADRIGRPDCKIVIHTCCSKGRTVGARGSKTTQNNKTTKTTETHKTGTSKVRAVSRGVLNERIHALEVWVPDPLEVVGIVWRPVQLLAKLQFVCQKLTSKSAPIASLWTH